MTGRCLLYYVFRRSRYHCGAVLFSGHPSPLVSAEFTESISQPGKATSTSALDTPPTTERILVGPKASISSVAAGLASAETPRPSARRCSEFRPWKQPTSKKKLNVPRSGARSVTSPTTKVAPETLLRLAASIARGTLSTPTASQPLLASSGVYRPGPQPRSSARPSGCDRSASSRSSRASILLAAAFP